MKTRIATFAMFVSLTAMSALAQTVTYDYDSAANFASYKTYAWTRGTELTDELTHARVVRALDAFLAAKGLSRVEPNARPDVFLAYHASFEQDLEFSGATHGWGPFGPDRWGSARIQPLLVGLLLVNISDAQTGAIVFRSFANSDVRLTDKPEIRDRKIAKAAGKMFQNYPPKPGAKQ
jgi:hypothetical protein